MIDKIDAILDYLTFKGIDCCSSWLNQHDGPYIIVRNRLWIKYDSMKALKFLVSLNGDYMDFAKYIENEVCKNINPPLDNNELIS